MKAMAALVLAAFLPQAALAEGFRLDLADPDLRAATDSPVREDLRRVDAMAVGETGVTFGGYCTGEGRLMVYGGTALAAKPLDFLNNHHITRTGPGTVELSFKAGARADPGVGPRDAASFAGLRPCAPRADEALLLVERVQGTDSLSALVAALAAGAGAPAAAPAAAAPVLRGADAGGWITRTETDAITDQKNVFISMEPQETPRNLFGGVKRVSLMMRCLRNRTSVFISFDDYQVADRIGVVWRLDDRQPTSAQWNIASDRKAAGLWDGRGAIPFLKELAGASRLVMRLSLDRSTETYTFDIAGSADEVAEVAAACNWAP